MCRDVGRGNGSEDELARRCPPDHRVKRRRFGRRQYLDTQSVSSTDPVSSLSLTVPSGRRVTCRLTRRLLTTNVDRALDDAWMMPEWSRTSRKAKCSPCSRRLATQPQTLTCVRRRSREATRTAVTHARGFQILDILSSSSVVRRPRRRPRFGDTTLRLLEVVASQVSNRNLARRHLLGPTKRAKRAPDFGHLHLGLHRPLS